MRRGPTATATLPPAKASGRFPPVVARRCRILGSTTQERACLFIALIVDARVAPSLSQAPERAYISRLLFTTTNLAWAGNGTIAHVQSTHDACVLIDQVSPYRITATTGPDDWTPIATPNAGSSA